MNQITTIGLDTSKNVFHIVGINQAGKTIIRKQLRRKQLLRFFVQQPVSVIGIETCGGSHYWARELTQLGHQVRLVPARDVKALVRGQKNDYNDALAIAEAVGRPQQRFSPIKQPADHDIQALHRLRRGYIGERTAQGNRLRGLLAEHGLVIAKGLAPLRRRIPELLEDGDNTLGSLTRDLLYRALQHLYELDREIQHCDQLLKELVRNDPSSQRLMTTPGFGPMVASVWRVRMGDCRQFHRGRDASAACGLVPQQHTTGGRPQLLGITKRGDKELRTLLIHGARSVIRHAHKKDDALSLWVCQLVARVGHNKAAVALANKMVRIAWAMTVHETDYVPRMAA